MAKVGITKPTDTDDGMVWLNVGESPVGVHRSGLKRTNVSCTTFILADLFETDATWDKRLSRDHDGRIVLDQSPHYFRRILHTLLKYSGEAVPGKGISRSNDDDTPIVDEETYLVYYCWDLRLSERAVLMVSRGVKIFDADEVSHMVATIQGWLHGQSNELNLLYRASRDGWNGAAFHARCGEDSTSMITVIRVRNPIGSDSSTDSIVGGFSSVPWRGSTSGHHESPGALLFMLKDGSKRDKSVPFRPKIWGMKYGSSPQNVFRDQAHCPTFGGTRTLIVSTLLRARTLRLEVLT